MARQKADIDFLVCAGISVPLILPFTIKSVNGQKAILKVVVCM